MLQDVKVFSEDGTSKVVEILADMTARDLCQLLVYKSHCVDDNSWTLVEHHPHLGLGREWSKGWLPGNIKYVYFVFMCFQPERFLSAAFICTIS